MIQSGCKSYHANLVNRSSIRLADGLSVYKVYYLSIIGRQQPERYEWGRCNQTYHDFEALLAAGLLPGVGFITAFPHITKVFRFSPQAETVLDVSEYNTADFTLMDCVRDNNFHEFACYAEALIVAAEYQAWAETVSLVEYLDFSCSRVDFSVKNNNKLSSYWQPGKPL